MSQYSEFFLNTRPSVVQLETLEISHPSFSQVYYVTANDTKGVTALDENSVSKTYMYYPLAIRPTSGRKDLDFGIEVEMADLGETLPAELDRVMEAVAMGTKPTLI